MTTKTAPPAAAPRAAVRKVAKAPAASAAATKTAAARTRKPASAAVQAKSTPQAAEATEHPPTKANKKLAKQRPVLVRDSFTMPETDFALLAMLKASALTAQRAAKKSELLRAGLQLLATLDKVALVAALDRLEAVKTGRPKKKG